MPSTDNSVLIGLLVPVNLVLFFCCFAGVAFALWKYRTQPPPPQPEKRALSVIEQMRAGVDEEPKPLKIRAPISIKLTK